MHSSSPARTPKLQLAAEQPSTGESSIPSKKDTPLPRTKENPKQDSRRGKLCLESNPIPAREAQRAQRKCVHQENPHSARSALECLNNSCGGKSQQWPAAGGFGFSRPGYGISPLGGDHQISPP